MGQRDFYRYRAGDGLQVPVYVTLPPGKPKGPLPTVVLVHGGPYVHGTSWEWEREAQFLASRGYVVLQPEFRGTLGYGVKHFQAGWKQWGRAMQDDLADAAQWAVKQGWAEPGRIAIMGASYGGYATLMGLIRHPDIFRCGIDLMGVSDIGMMFSVVESDLPQEWLEYGAKTMLGDPDDPALASVSPLAQAARLTRPLLIAHGAKDRRVPIVHARRMKDALAKHNNAVEYVVYDDEGHGLYHRENRIDFYKRVEAFLARHLRQ
ncbi:alpha/beta hydrolase family protein [Pseudoduganella lutea]|nr:alpha/beta fold hydrolase [Pseudoduganella lutea]